MHARKLRVEYVFPETSLVQKTPDLYHTKDLEAKLENAQAEVARLRSLIASGSASVIHDGTPYAAAAQSSLSASYLLAIHIVCAQHRICIIRTSHYSRSGRSVALVGKPACMYVMK